MRWLFIALLLSSTVVAEDRWIIMTSGPFEIYSGAGEKPARQILNELEQFREGFGNTIGHKDLKLTWPLRVLIYKRQTPVPAGRIALGRDAYMAALTDKDPSMSPEMKKQLARLLLDQNTNRLPENIESGLIELFSTLQIDGTHLTLGAPVPQNERTRDWARMQMLNVDPAYSGRARVMINILEQSPDMDAACHNAFEKKPAEIEKQLDAYMSAGTYGTTTLSGRAISPTRDFHAQPLESDASRLARADLLLASNQLEPARAEYAQIHGPEGSEGLGLIALKQGNKDEARKQLSSATKAGSKSAQAWLQLALLESDAANSRFDLHHAADANPNWGEPWRQLANYDPNPAQKVADLKKATVLDRRNSEYWEELAKVATKANMFTDAAKAWSGAERAAANDKERDSIRAMRLEVEKERADYEEAQRKAAAEAQARELARVKQETMDQIHAAEDAARKELNPHGEAVPKATVWMDELNGDGKIEGTFERLECTGKLSRLVIQSDDGKLTRLAVRDMSHVGVSGGETKIACGVQKPAKRVSVQYVAKPDKRLGTIGDVTIIEFH